MSPINRSLPMMFSAPMVLAILAGTKTQTRRPISLPMRAIAKGDVIWVKEALCRKEDGSLCYAADLEPVDPMVAGRVQHASLANAMFMPVAAARLFLEVTETREHPIWQITPADAVAEGALHREHFVLVWAGLHTRRPDRWEDNPDVVALTFRRVAREHRR